MDRRAIHLSLGKRAEMARLITDSKGRGCTYIRIPEDKECKKALYKYADLNGLDVSTVPIGYERVRVVLVPSTQAVHDTIFKADDREQKRVKADAERLTSIEDAKEKAGDASYEISEIAVGIISETEKYDAARELILEHIKKHHPERYDQFILQFEGYSRRQAAVKLGMASSTAYKIGVKMTKELKDILESLEYLEIKKYSR